MRPNMIKLLILFLLIIPNAWATNWCADTDTVLGAKMEETSSTYADCSSSSNTGTVSGSMTRNGTPKYGTNALDDNEVNNAYVDFGSAASLDNITALTVCAWVAADTDGNNGGSLCDAGSIIGKNDNSDGWNLCFQKTGQIRFRVRFSGSGSVNWTTNDTPYSSYDGSYHHICATYNNSSTSNDPIIYFDGSARAITESTAPVGTYNTDAAFTVKLGLENTASNEAEFDGRLDEIFISKRVLNSTEINNLMNCGLDGTNCAAGSKKLMTLGDE